MECEPTSGSSPRIGGVGNRRSHKLYCRACQESPNQKRNGKKKTTQWAGRRQYAHDVYNLRRKGTGEMFRNRRGPGSLTVGMTNGLTQQQTRGRLFGRKQCAARNKHGWCTPKGADRKYITTVTDVMILNYAVGLDMVRAIGWDPIQYPGRVAL